MSTDVSAWQYPSLKTILGSLLLGFGREVVGIEELVDYGLVLADAIAQHTPVVAIGVDAHLDVNDISSFVGYKG